MGHVFELERLQEIAKRGQGLPFDEMNRVVVEELSRAYPRHIETRPNWMFNLAGGATGMMRILHASLTEYLIIFGSEVGTEAFSGRYLLEIHDFVLTGEMWTYLEHRPGERIVTRVGEHAVLGRGQTKGYRIQEGTWMLEYARGLVPTSLPMALGDAVFSGQDALTVIRTLGTYGRLVVRELLQGKI